MIIITMMMYSKEFRRQHVLKSTFDIIKMVNGHTLGYVQYRTHSLSYIRNCSILDCDYDYSHILPDVRPSMTLYIIERTTHILVL